MSNLITYEIFSTRFQMWKNETNKSQNKEKTFLRGLADFG